MGGQPRPGDFDTEHALELELEADAKQTMRLLRPVFWYQISTSTSEIYL